MNEIAKYGTHPTAEKVKAHQEEKAARLARLANEWADTEAKSALALHQQPSGLDRLAANKSWNDAVTACRVLARATLLWPTAAALRDGQRQPTTLEQRRRRAGLTAERAARRRALRRQAHPT